MEMERSASFSRDMPWKSSSKVVKDAELVRAGFALLERSFLRAKLSAAAMMESSVLFDFLIWPPSPAGGGDGGGEGPGAAFSSSKSESSTTGPPIAGPVARRPMCETARRCGTLSPPRVPAGLQAAKDGMPGAARLEIAVAATRAPSPKTKQRRSKGVLGDQRCCTECFWQTTAMPLPQEAHHGYYQKGPPSQVAPCVRDPPQAPKQ
mmetsp:Transcript_58632/g.126008  ORF Transcript_58632/g.126008 Transcript_58632/m.126008 type:complete len:207 (+) Transcript_58632:569-1189(+)